MTTKGPHRVFLVDDHQVVRRGLRSFLESWPDLTVVGEARSGEEAIAVLGSPDLDVDVVVMDIKMPGMGGVEATARLRASRPLVQILILTSYGDVANLQSALRAGVTGYILKDATPEAVADAVRATAVGKMHLDPSLSGQLVGALRAGQAANSLTPREREVVNLVAQGFSNADIAAELFISERTARTHVSHLLTKLELESRIQLALWALENGYPTAAVAAVGRGRAAR